MKNWTIEDLYDLWRGRGYTKKEAKEMAEKDYNEMNRKKSDEEKHQIMQEMIYNQQERKAFPGVRFPGFAFANSGRFKIERWFYYEKNSRAHIRKSYLYEDAA